MTSALIQQQLCSAVLDTLDQEICVIDNNGDIVYVNRAWVDFGTQNFGMITDWLHTNYLSVCNVQDTGDGTTEVVRGIRRVLDGVDATFTFEYPCDSPDESRWFMMQMKPLSVSNEPLYVISHLNITQRKLAERHAESLSIRDPLTGLSNRRHFESFFVAEWQRCLREQTSISLVIFDIDHFKDINDRFGHGIGDDCLVRVADIIRDASRRAGDIAVRWGGEEFILLLGNTTQEGAMKIAEDVRLQVLQLPDVNGVKLTLSAGVASTVPNGAIDHRLLSLADDALYQAKRTGRNKVLSGNMRSTIPGTAA